MHKHLTMARIYIPTNSANDWRALLAEPDKHWREGYSAMCAALCWEAASGLPEEIGMLFGVDSELLLAIPEHKVPMPGRGRESQCDVFALLRQGDDLVSVAVEAKVDEPFGPTVGEWLDAGGQGRVDRLRALCEIIEVRYPPPHNLRYQLFHRTAAGVLEAGRFRAKTAAMIVHSFSAQHRWHEDFAAFCAFMSLPGDRAVRHERELKNDLKLSLAWATGKVRRE
jgi:hypothetical protein